VKPPVLCPLPCRSEAVSRRAERRPGAGGRSAAAGAPAGTSVS